MKINAAIVEKATASREGKIIAAKLEKINPRLRNKVPRRQKVLRFLAKVFTDTGEKPSHVLVIVMVDGTLPFEVVLHS